MKKVFRHKKTLIVSSGLIVGLIVIGVVAVATHHSKRMQRVASPAAVPTIINAPATAQEKADSEQHKEAIVEQQNNNQSAPIAADGKKSVTPTITSAYSANDQIVVSGYVSGIFEDGGTCTVTLTQGTNKALGSSPAFANASTTDCQTINISRSSLTGGGVWQVTLSYSSATSEGTSQAKTISL